MGRVTDIFDRVRDKIGDPNGTRWTEAQLIRLLNDGLDDVAVHTKMFRGTAQIALIQGFAQYDLPEDLIDLKKVLYKGKPLKLVNSTFMEEKVSYNWRTETTSDNLQYSVFDQEDIHRLRVYPRPLTEDFGVVYEFDSSVYGFDDTIEGYEADTYGVISAIIDAEDEPNENDPLYGVLSSVSISEALFIIYNRTPRHVVTTLDEMEVPKIYDKALACFVAGKALRQDIDAQNRQMGEEELGYYMRDLNEAKGNTSRNQVSGGKHGTIYRGMG